MAFTVKIDAITRIADESINVEVTYDWPERSYSSKRVFNLMPGAYGVDFAAGAVAKRTAVKAFVQAEGSKIKPVVDTNVDLQALVGDSQNIP